MMGKMGEGFSGTSIKDTWTKPQWGRITDSHSLCGMGGGEWCGENGDNST